jgi:hypothetical protein
MIWHMISPIGWLKPHIACDRAMADYATCATLHASVRSAGSLARPNRRGEGTFVVRPEFSAAPIDGCLIMKDVSRLLGPKVVFRRDGL